MMSNSNTNKTLLAHHDSFDRFFFIMRAMFFIGSVAWVCSTYSQASALPHLAAQMLAGVIPPLLWYLSYSIFFFFLNTKFPERRSITFHVLLILDIAFVTAMVFYTGHGNSDFYLGYYLFIAAHTMAFSMVSGAMVTVISSILYMALYFLNPDRFFISDFAVRTGFMFLVFFVIASLAENEKRDRGRMEEDRRKIDELNHRLEESMADVIEDKQSISESHTKSKALLQREKEDKDRRGHHISFSKELISKATVEESIQHFSRYVSGLLSVDDVAVITPDKDEQFYLFKNQQRKIIKSQVPATHPLLRNVDSSAGHIVEWRVGDKNQPIPKNVILVDYEPAVVRAEPLLEGQVRDGIMIISHSEPCKFTRDLMDEARMLCNVLCVHIRTLKLQFKLQELAETDGLTGIYNHRYFQNTLDQELMRSERYERPLSLILFDIDHFKKFNDTYGHRVGDSVLQELTKVVASKLRNLDILARYGGEEFIVILPETPISGAMDVAERVRQAVEQHEVPYEGHDPLRVEVSVGVASFPKYKTKPGLIEAADQALYRAKEGGRNRVEC